MENTMMGVEFVYTGDRFADCLGGLRAVLKSFEGMEEKEKKQIVAALALSVGVAPNTDFNLTQPAASQVKS